LKKAYQVLQNRFNGVPDVEIWNFACGSKPVELEMYTEDANQGQSSSLMKPKQHLKEYPQIRFTGREPVKVFPLDFLSTIGCNILMIDTQGFELEVLRGAKETLRNIDVVYSEVNRAEMYEGCPMIEDLDEYLKQFDFERKETVWYANGNWGDGIWLKRKPL
jgi:FkbM family methyltransferase